MSIVKSSIKRMLPSVAYNYLREYRNLWVCRTRQKVPDSGARAQIFASFYGTDLWGSSESSSGYGSTLEQTRSLRATLPILLSDCVASQAGCHGFASLAMALRMVRSLRMQATMATIFGLPAVMR